VERESEFDRAGIVMDIKKPDIEKMGKEVEVIPGDRCGL